MENINSNQKDNDDGYSGAEEDFDLDASPTRCRELVPFQGAPATREIPAHPLLPKTLFPEWRQPPSCPLKDIHFVQI